jgi:AAA15 family ATPase/GTPase
MIIQFSTSNFRTFKDRVALNLVASNYDKETRETENVIFNDKYKLRNLKSAVIYGANASGKSKFIEALMFMRRFAINSSKDSQTGDEIDVEPFKLNTESIKSPSEFEVVFLYDKIQYRYGFEVDKQKVVAEWLFQKPKTKEIELFYRDEQDFDIHPRNFKKGSIAVKEGLVRDNALLLSLAAQLNDEIAINVINWFKSLKTISGLREEGYQGYTMSRTKEPKTKLRILELLKAADLGIQDIKLELLDIDKLPKDLPKEIRDRIIKESKEENSEIVSDVLTTHKQFDSNKKHIDDINFSMDVDESSGTRKFFALTGPIIDVLENGYILVVDELDSKLHPNLVCKLVSLFNSKELNPENAQLIFNTHDTNLLGSGLFRRDQIWFTEKDKFGSAKLYSLSDFKTDSVRKNEAFEENYIRGKYGSVPYLGFFESLTFKNLLLQDENEG